MWKAGSVVVAAAIAVLAVGQLLVILTRGIDLSVGSTIALAIPGSTPASPIISRGAQGHRCWRPPSLRALWALCYARLP